MKLPSVSAVASTMTVLLSLLTLTSLFMGREEASSLMIATLLLYVIAVTLSLIRD